MDIGEVSFAKPNKLECVDSVYVKDMTAAALEEHEKKLKEFKDNPDEALRYKAVNFLCDENGKGLTGLGSVEEMKAKISLGKLRDMITEAEQVLVLGKTLATRLRQTAA